MIALVVGPSGDFMQWLLPAGTHAIDREGAQHNRIGL